MLWTTAMRAALYFTPPRDHALSRAASAWLGRDPWPAGAVPAVADSREAPGDGTLVHAPRRYGFHATLKPPFHLAAGTNLATLRDAAAAFAAVQPAATIESLALVRIGAFFALVPGGAAPGLEALASAVVTAFEPFRAPPSEAEVARRSPERLTPRQREHLAAWGYPYVFDEFRFHMTLTGKVPEAERDAVEALLRARFAPVIGRPLAVDLLCLFVEPKPPGDFVVDTAVPLAAPTG
jgi:putative phosphonate metabolism protein